MSIFLITILIISTPDGFPSTTSMVINLFSSSILRDPTHSQLIRIQGPGGYGRMVTKNTSISISEGNSAPLLYNISTYLLFSLVVFFFFLIVPLLPSPGKDRVTGSWRWPCHYQALHLHTVTVLGMGPWHLLTLCLEGLPHFRQVPSTHSNFL